MKKTIITLCVLLILSLSVQSQWTALNSGIQSTLSEVFFLDNQTGFIIGWSCFIKTTNGGLNWDTLSRPVPPSFPNSMHFFNASTGLACGYGWISRTTTGGMNWNILFNNHLYPFAMFSFNNNDTGICCGDMGANYYTTNGGSIWSLGGPYITGLYMFSCFMLNNLTGYCGGYNSYVPQNFGKTTNGGINWVYSQLGGTSYGIHFFDDQNGIVAQSLEILRTTNGGVSWSSQQFPNVLYSLDFPSASIGYCVGLYGYIIKTTNGGVNWNQQISGTSNTLTSVYFVDTVLGFAVGGNGTLLKTTNGGVTGISGWTGEVPDDFRLFQNYPNPFNPATKIKFDIPPSKGARGMNVKLVIFDVLGREITTLVNEQLSPGTYKVQWDASSYPSGVYFYKLVTNDYSETRKMVLIK